MTVLLTGATGFVGKHLQNYIDCVPLADGNTTIDLRNATKVTEFICDVRPDMVVHLAAQSFVPASFEDPQETFDINFYGTFNLLNALNANGFEGRLLYVGTGDVYGRVSPGQLPISEDLPPKPRNPYAVSKVAAEALCYQWSQTEKFAITMARPFNHFGPGQNIRFVISDFAKQIIEIKLGKRPAKIHVGDVDVTRDFTDVRDVVKAYGLLLEHGKNSEIYNVCSGIECSIRSLLDKMLEIAQTDADIITNMERIRPSEQRRVVGNFEKLNLDTGWQPELTIEQSLMDILTEWQRVII